MNRERPPLLLRLAVVVGAFTLVLGLIGVVFMILRADDGASAAGPGLVERVRVLGAVAGTPLVVNVRWEDDAILHQEEALPFGNEPGVFLLPPQLGGRQILIEVRDAETERPIASRKLLLREGEEVRLQVEQAAER